MARLGNPVAFTKGPATVITALLYIGLIVWLIIVHTVVPHAPSAPPHGINITEAWQDLQILTAAYHPYLSRKNDEVRNWLLLRINDILLENSASNLVAQRLLPAAYLFNDDKSNLSFSSPGSTTASGYGISVHFEGTNIIVYIPGSEDDTTEWWTNTTCGPSSFGVLVNAHYDSVSTGFGATDDGVGVVSVLQLIRYYTTPGNKPKKGLVALLNDGEEDYLNGAKVFSQHPVSKFPHTFLNLEGAGAGGRAALFRSTDTEVARAYKQSPYPFGTVISADGFKRGLIRSQTDYVIFNGILGMRGLDVAFLDPRARYHTGQDDARHTSKDSVWHMLSAALATTRSLTSDDSSTSNGESSTKSVVSAGHGTQGVWFDFFGRVFVVFRLHTLFAVSITLLVIAPVSLILLMITLSRADKFYPFSGSRSYHDEVVSLYGWRGFFRWPLILVASCAAPIGLAFLMFKVNTYIAHSSEWAVWSMMFSSFIIVAWMLCRAAAWARPSALTRLYGLTWLLLGWWAILVVGVVAQARYRVAGGYFVIFYFSGVLLATWISYLELFAIPQKGVYCRQRFPGASRNPSLSSRRLVNAEEQDAEGEDDATERTRLLDREDRSTFANYSHDARNDVLGETDDSKPDGEHDGLSEEQEWSNNLPRWTWLLQFILLAPVVIVVLGQSGLLVITGLHQTGPDGSSMLLVYLAMAVFTILILSPLLPFLHRYTWHIPVFLLLVLTGTLIYNLLAFPFSANNRLKLYFRQELDLDTGINSVSLTGVSPYVEQAIVSIPSASGVRVGLTAFLQQVDCVSATPGDRKKCSWKGPFPNVVAPHSKIPPELRYRTWVNFNVSRASANVSTNTKARARDIALLLGLKGKSDTWGDDSNVTESAQFMLSSRNTRGCKLMFDSPISDFFVHGSAPNDDRFPPVPKGGSKEIRLWSRTWDRIWTVDVKWDSKDGDGGGMTGKVVCLWSDSNQQGVIPALDELRRFAPDWVAITKAGDGLVEGSKRFIL